MSANLFEPFELGDPIPANRMVLALMTRNNEADPSTFDGCSEAGDTD